MTELNEDIENKEKKIEEEEKDDYIFPQKSHWEKYQIYYLVFGCFFVTLLIILANNSAINNRIRKNNEKLGGESYDDIKFSSPKMSDHFSRLDKEPFPEHVKERVKEEISKISKNPLSGHEKEMREDWINQVMKFPWYQTATEKDNIIEVENALNKKHFGMKKVKESIIELLAAKKQTGKNFGKVICLTGAPGVGKTSIARSIAEALGRPFERISLGGVHDEAEIRGHRSTYIGAKPGIIIQACQKAKVKNPVINIDEIDKLGESKYHGSPAAAFLEILDAEQNEFFRDHYIELATDLSQVMFICTANQVENIPGPLRDRMEIIEVPSYTENDKIHIAKDFLIPKLLITHNLTKEKLSFEDEAIQKIITDYTWEAGARNLETKLRRIVWKFLAKINKKEINSENITTDKVRDYLGKPTTSDLTFESDYSSPGVVNGLSVCGQGISVGDVLPIEVIFFSGEGKIATTGNLKETMKESAEVALSYVKNNLEKFDIAENIKFIEKNLHIHVPKGGIPKDGPSAGTALTTAIISALTGKKINRYVAMTGEITLHGHVEPIGGLREKLAAAHRKGLKTIFIPKNNERDLDDVPSEVKNMQIITVSNYWEIWEKIKELNLFE
jgi:ATP-dependent Lon protease